MIWFLSVQKEKNPHWRKARLRITGGRVRVLSPWSTIILKELTGILIRIFRKYGRDGGYVFLGTPISYMLMVAKAFMWWSLCAAFTERYRHKC